MGAAAMPLILERVKKPVEFKCPDCICPKQEPCNGIDFEKIKSKNLTIQNQQYLTIDGDSTLKESIRLMFVEEFEKRYKCKGK
jgi:hypothetical protein